MILITGASGFLGRRLVCRALEQGRAVRALVRNPGACADFPVPTLIHQGDITEPATLTAALEDVTMVIHAAATTSETATDELPSWRTNVEGTRNLIAACHKARVTRWIQMSTLSANPANGS